MERERREHGVINNAFYEELDDAWYEASDHPIALLRQENAVRTPWVIETIARELPGSQQVLDIGCGGGFLSNPLALAGHRVIGIDLSEGSLITAKKRDTTQSVEYLRADATLLPFPDQSFDVVCAMDLLEHVEQPERVIQEASRVLKKGGLFFFHTFNRNVLSWLIVIKGVEWCVPNTPKNMHVYPLFIKPKELKAWSVKNDLDVQEMKGLMPCFFSKAALKSVISRKVCRGLRFKFIASLAAGYVGFSQKKCE
jgi:2-polyprenyl-6-hydroxyphenyl methylase/3-demethylubiquinone-9 3-methyltransferase